MSTKGIDVKYNLAEMLSAISRVIPVAEWLESSAYDELVEIDLNADRYRIISYVTDKDSHVADEGRFSDMCQFVIDRLVHPEDVTRYAAFVEATTLMQRLAESKHSGVLVDSFRFRIKGGSWRWVEVCIIGGRVHGFASGIVRLYTFDIQAQVERSESELIQQNAAARLFRNDKTNLLWERSFFLMAEKRRGEVEAKDWCVIAIDIDHFSLFNDWYGRETGDHLLSRMGEELTLAEEKSTGIAGYLGQDDFCLFAPYDPDRLTNLYTRLGNIITELTSAIGFKPVFGICITDESTPIIDLLDRARFALDYAKTDYKTDICLYEPEMHDRNESEYRILLDFQQGIRENQFITYLQPQCRVSTGKIIGAEALVRWLKPDGTIVPPDEFIPVLEHHGFITDLDCYVWDRVCNGISNWIKSGHTPIPISVNVSQEDFYNIDVAEHFKQLVEKYELPTSLLKIEITESAFVEDSDSFFEVIKQLRDFGFMVLMDDFGSGYSSLNRLGNLNVDVIKLDADFFRADNEGKHKVIHIVESIINMTKTMAIPIICEGVETQEQIDFLESLGCRYVQGYYFYRPMPASDFMQLIDNGTELDESGFVAKQNEQLRIREFLDQNINSDAMLNRILGPVAFYLWHEDDIDIIRFNEQFYEAVGVPDFDDRLLRIQQFVPADDVPKLFDLVKRATQDSLNGASDIIGFYKSDGSLSRFMMQMYYLGENSEGKRFYGSVQDVTEITDLHTELRILSDRLQTSIMFMRWQNDAWHFKVIIHGLVDETGLTQDEFQRQLDDGTLLACINEDDYKALFQAAKTAFHSESDFFGFFNLDNGSGQSKRFKIEADRVKDVSGEGSYIIKMIVV